MNCVAKPLRFEVGTKILARVTKGWTQGTVIAQWDGGNAYRVKLSDDKGTEVWAPIDDDICIKAAASP